jgi:hypothetical protein
MRAMPTVSRPDGRLLYLGEEIDPATGSRRGRAFALDPDRLTTHAVCFGMTGSGKTGMCLVLLEEAIRLGVPLFLLDPKGDLANLMLTFPGLTAAEFRPWIDPGQAQAAGQTPEAWAEATASRWREGLASSGLGPGDVASLAGKARITLHTPGSTAGVPVNVLGGFLPPPVEGWDSDPEMLRARIAGTVAALLDLVGVRGRDVTDPEAIVLSRLFESRWRAGEALTLESLVRDLLDPPEDLRTLGAMDLDSVLPKARRTGMATAINALLAAPSFGAWAQGEPLDPAALSQAGADGRTPVRLFHLSHLTDAERSFFVAVFLQAVVTWTRSLPGSSSLRALVYMDEIAGYFPPVADPPTKAPLLTMLKQARAFGVGTVLATQNPVDIDYKGLSNAGTWFLGRLQTEQDRERLLDGMASTGIQRGRASQALAALPPRTFLVHDAREPELRGFATRWAMSYLRGPVTREEVRRLTKAAAIPAAPAPAGNAARPPDEPSASRAAAGASRAGRATREEPPDGVPERFAAAPAGAVLTPALRARVRLVFEDVRAGVHEVQHEDLALPLAVSKDAQSLDWSRAAPAPGELAPGPPEAATYEDLPAAWRASSSWRAAGTSLKSYLATGRALPLLRHAELELLSRPGESREEFLRRCETEARRRADEEALRLKGLYERKISRLKARAEKELRELEADRQQHEGRKLEEIVSAGETLLGIFLGGRRRSVAGMTGRRRMTAGSAAKVDKSQAEYEAARTEMERMQEEAEQELAALDARWDALAGRIAEAPLKARKTGIEVLELALLWMPEITA